MLLLMKTSQVVKQQQPLLIIHQVCSTSQYLRDRGTKTLHYLSMITVNGFPGIENTEKRHFEEPRQPF